MFQSDLIVEQENRKLQAIDEHEQHLSISIIGVAISSDCGPTGAKS